MSRIKDYTCSPTVALIFVCLSLKKKWPLIKSLLFLCRNAAACACFRKFFARIVLCRLLSFSLISIKNSVKEQTIMISIYLFWVFMNIFNVCHWKEYYICSLGIYFLQNSYWYRATRAPNSLLELYTWTGADYWPGLSSAWSGPWFRSWVTLK